MRSRRIAGAALMPVGLSLQFDLNSFEAETAACEAESWMADDDLMVEDLMT
jgi:hypothetical protein